MLTPKEIQANYHKMQDSQIIDLAENPQGLRKDVIPVLAEEIRRRNLDPELISWVVDVNNEYEGVELEKLRRDIRKARCPICNSSGGLVGFKYDKVTSYIIGYNIKHYGLLVCRSCRKSIIQKNVIFTFLLGWWSRHGFLAAPVSILTNLYNTVFHRKIDESVIGHFIRKNVGILRRIKTDHELSEYIRFQHKIKQDL